MADPFDIRTFTFPTLADLTPEDVLTSVQVLRGESDRKGRRKGTFREADREQFQREALTGGNRLDRVLATLDAIVQQNPAAALGAALPGPAGGIASLAGLVEGRRNDVPAGNILRELARATTMGGTALTSRRGGSAPTSVEREFARRAEREDRESNRELREGRGSGASPRRGDVSNAGR